MTQQVPPPLTPYGSPISFDDARIAMEAAEGEANRNRCAVAREGRRRRHQLTRDAIR
jgi:hypothetical protein